MDCSICIASVSWLWISLECVLFSEFSERGREDWEAAGNKLGVRVRSGLGSLQWGTLRAQQNTQGLSSSSCNHRPFGELPTADMSETPKGQAFLIFFTRVKNGCNLQMPGLPPQWLYLPALGSFPRWGVRLKAFLQRACATILLAKWFQSSRGDVQSKTAVTQLSMIYPERCERSLAVLAHTKQPWWERFGDDAHLKLPNTQESVTSSHWHKNIFRSHSHCGPSFPTHPWSVEHLDLKVVCGEGTGRGA